MLDPNQELTWKHLGYVKHNGRWMSRLQLESDRLESEARVKAAKTWEPVLKTWRGWLADDEKREAAQGFLAEIRDPRAVPSIVRVFRGGNEADMMLAVQLLGQIDSPASTQALSELAVLNPVVKVRTAATKALKSREPRDYAGQLVDMIQSPMTYKVQPVAGPGAPGAIEVQTPRFKMLRTYDAPPAFELSNQFYGYVGFDGNGLPVAARGVELKKMAREGTQMAMIDLAKIEARTSQLLFEANLKAADSQGRLSADVYAIEMSNAQAAQTNSRIVPVLTENLDAPAELKDSEDGWKTWWNDKLGYTYEAPQQVQVAVNASPQSLPPRIYSCFVAGTLVRTLEGARPIETLSVGDRVLTQDAATGELSFQSIQVVHHNSPGATLRVATDNGEELFASVYHRFWRAGRGWAMARELKAGDVVRTLDGLTRIVSVSNGEVERLYNLDVANSRTFFVGKHAALVHDNTLPDAHLKPFDAGPEIVAKAPGR